MLRRLALCFGLMIAPCTMRAAQLPQHVFHFDIPVESYPEIIETDLEATIKDWRRQLEGEGFRPFLSYWGDFLANPVGGRDQDASWMQLLVFGGELGLDRFGVEGGSVVVSAVDAAGSNLSLRIGNVFTVSQAYVMNTFSLFDLYYKQRLLDGRLEVSLGRMAAGQFFATIPAMGLVVSGAVNGNPTSLFVNTPFHATAGASWAAYAKYKPVADAYIETGVFQASPRIGNPAYHGADLSIRAGDGVLLMTEMGWTPTFAKTPGVAAKDGKSSPAFAGLPGIYSFGAYYANYAMPAFSGGVEHNTFGFYGIAQQMLWRSRRDGRHFFSLWGGITYSPQEDVAMMPVMGMGGAIWQGLIPTRDADNVLLSFYTGGFSSRYADGQFREGLGRPTVETVLEASYLIQLTANVQLQPDLQWIIRPGGTGQIPDALVVGFQVAVTF